MIVRPESAAGLSAPRDRRRFPKFRPLRNKRVGLVTNQTGRTRGGASTIDVLSRAPDVRLVKLFSPEHGIRGEMDTTVTDSVDDVTGLPMDELMGNAERDARQCKRKKDRREPKYGCGIAFLNRVKDLPIPDVDAVLHGDIEDDEKQQSDNTDPRDLLAGFSPEAAR